jgi:hypothetical protein
MIVIQSVRPRLRNERLAVGLNIVLFVGGAADDRWLSVPPQSIWKRVCASAARDSSIGPASGSASSNFEILPWRSGQARDAVIAGAYLHHSRWRCDDGICLHPGWVRGLRSQGLRVAVRFPPRHQGWSPNSVGSHLMFRLPSRPGVMRRIGKRGPAATARRSGRTR